MGFLEPPPIRRLTGQDELTERLPTELESSPSPPAVNGNGNGAGREHANGDAAVRDRADKPLNGSAGAPAPVLASRSRGPSDAPLAIDRMHVDDVSVAYGRKLAVDQVSLPIRQGEVLALIGPSGCGKTTLLRSLNRLTELNRDVRQQGRITLDEVDIGRIDPTALRRRVTMVFQQPNPFPMSVFDNVAYVLREQAARRPRRAALRGAVRDALSRAGLLDELGDDLDHPALRLSGGQQQRLCIARALAADPEVLLLDEPCSALDPQSTAVIEELIVKLREYVAVVIVTHNLQQAYRVADYVGFMYLGRLIEYGSATQVFRQPREQRTREYVRGDFG
jgi:phosphate transport system ATP-binding protein